MLRLLALISLLCFPAAAGETPALPADPENTAYLDLDDGRVVIRMRPDLAPRHVERVKHLIRGGYYDGLVFYRVIENFAAQTGDTKGDGTGAGTGRAINAEFTRTPQVRGTVSMARTSKRNSADAEWFIVLADHPDTRKSLDGKYSVWGQVTSGMEFVDQIPKGEKAKDGRGIENPARIVKMQIAADAEAAQKRGVAELLARADAATTAQTFSASEFKCSGLINGQGVTTQSALAQLWTHGYLAGRFTAGNALTFDTGAVAGDDPALAETCARFPQAFLLTVASQELTREPRALAATTSVFPVESYTCKEFAASRKPAAKDQGELVGLWTFGFIQGYKNVSQPEMEIPYDARPRLLDAMAAACAKFPDRRFLDLASAVAAKVRIK
jgi:peptidylprolyl isomerase